MDTTETAGVTPPDSAAARAASAGAGASAAAAEHGVASISTITSSDIATRPAAPGNAGPAEGDRGVSPTTPAPGAPSVTGVVAGQSYETELLKLAASVSDPVSAREAATQFPSWRSRITLARDRAILQLIEADVALQTGTEAQACSLWKQVVRADLGERLKNTYTAMMQSCEGT